jgi:hypothetical protein
LLLFLFFPFVKKTTNESLSAQVSQLDRALKVERLANADYASERVDLLDELEKLRAIVSRERDDEEQTTDDAVDVDAVAAASVTNVETPRSKSKKKKSASSAAAAAGGDLSGSASASTSQRDEDSTSASTDAILPPPVAAADESKSNGKSQNSSPNKQPVVPTVAFADPNNYAPNLRTAAAQEIVESERKYVAFLAKLLTAFRDPMMSEHGSLASSEQVKKVFGNTDVIYGLSQTLLARLDERMRSFDNETTLIGDIFLSIQPFLKAYNEFANKFNRGLDALDACRNDARFRDWQGATERMHGIALRDLLIMPVQRLPRYVMLLEQLCVRTLPTHPDAAALANAARVMKETTEYVNSRRAEYESLAIVQQLGARLVGYDAFAQASGVLHVKDGRLQQTGPERHADVHVILLSNVFLVTRRTSTLRAAISRNSGSSAGGTPLRVKDVVQLYKNQTAKSVVGDALSFIVDVSESALSRPLKFQCESSAERDAWVAAITSAVTKLGQQQLQ